jgi:hypothetical protein
MLYCDVFDQLERGNVRYVVVSGVAVVLHGYMRPLADLDIVIDPEVNESQRALHALALVGFVPSIPLPLNLLSVLRMFDQMEREVDVFVRYHIRFEELWAGSKQVQVGESIARVVSLAHLLQAKRITGRPHDLQDIEGLLALGASGHKVRTDMTCESDISA